MKPNRINSTAQQTGFSLVELMVGLAIGLLVVLVIVQVISFFDAQNRTTRGAAEAQTNGGIALYTIGRELQMAGYPLLSSAADSPLNCTTPAVAAILTPVTITEGVAAGGVNASDAITLRYGTAPAGGVPSVIGGVSAPDVVLATNFGCQPDDIVLISSGTTCSQTSVNPDPGKTGKLYTTNTTVSLASVAGATAGARLACLGAWNAITYSVDGSGNLVRAINGGAPAPILAGVVNLQAQYGISATANSNVVTQWVDAVGAWAAPSVADRNRIKAIRIAVVARNDKSELTDVSSACSSLTERDPTGLCAWEGLKVNNPAPSRVPIVTTDSPAPAIDLSTADANWRRYRYRVFETIIPLRNVIWSKDAL